MAGTLGTIMGQVRLDVRQAVAGYAALRAQNQRTVYAMRGTGDSFVGAGKVMAATGAVGVYAFAKMVGAAAEFERKMDFFGAVTDTNAEKMQTLSKFTLQLAQDTIYSANEIADGFIELGKAGVTSERIIKDVGVAMANLGAAADIPLAESGQIITSTIQQFASEGLNAVKVVDLLAGAANASIADITDIGVSLKYVGGVANAAGLSFEDTTTAISLLAKAGIRGSTAGTSLRQMIVSFAGSTGPARNALKDIGILTEDGTNKFYDQHGALKPLSRVYQILNDHLDGYNQKEKLSYLRTIFNNRALSAASILTRDGAKGFKEMNKEMAKTTAADVASKRLDNLSGDIEILKGNIETLMITAGGPFQETMRTWVQGLTELVQAFSDLPPGTQEAIVQFLAVASATLVVMGAISIVIGTIARFVASMLKMGAAFKFVGRMAWVLGGALYDVLVAGLVALAAALGISVGWLLAIIAVIALMIVGIIYAYKKIDIFRESVNAIASAVWTAIKAIGAFFKTLFTDPSAAWEMIKSGFMDLTLWLAGQLRKVPGLIKAAFIQGSEWVGQMVLGAIKWFVTLVSKVTSLLADFVGQVVSYLTFRNVGYAIGFLVGTAIRLFTTLGIRVLSLVLSLVGKVFSLFASLPGKIGFVIGFLIGTAIRLFLALSMKIGAIVLGLVTRTVAFFRSLPGRILSILLGLVVRSIAAFQTLRRRGPEIISSMVDSVVGFFRALPGRVIGFVQKMADRAKEKFADLKSDAIVFGIGIADGLINGIKGLPGTISGILGQCIDAFKGVVQQAFNAAKDFAGGLWDGFKEGLGIHSPSFIEEAAWQITGVLDKETKAMASKTMQIQALGRKLTTTDFAVGDPNAVRAAESYASLASMQARNQNRASDLLASSGSSSGAPAASASTATTREEVPFRITNWRDGTGMMRDIAQDVVDDEADYDSTLGRMG